MSDEPIASRHRAVIAEASEVLAAHERIEHVCPEYDVLYSSWTGQHYVSANIESSDGSILASIVRHRPTPQQAVIAFAEALIAVESPEYLVTDSFRSSRRHWRYSAAADRIMELER